MNLDSTKWIIALGFSILLTLMSVITYISISQMDSNIENLAELVEVTNAKTAAAQSMRDGIYFRGQILAEMFLLDDVFERDGLRETFYKGSTDYIKHRSEILSYPLNSRELQLMSQLNPIAITTKEVNDEAAETIISDSSPAEMQKHWDEANQARRKLLEVIDQLIENQKQYARNTLDESVRYHENTSAIIVLLATATLLFGVLISIQVIRQAARKNEEMHHQASHDALTQLVNRKTFETKLSATILNSKITNREHAICYLDLDQFKVINDTCGHDAGDQLIINLSKLLQKRVRSNDTLGRLGGDEFGILLESCSLENALEIAEDIVSLIRSYEFIWKGRNFRVGASIGLVQINNESTSSTLTMREADVACYAAKDMGRNRVHVHALNDEYVKKIHQELSWVADIDNSLKNHRFKLFAQPITHVNKTSSTRSMFEVLLRLKDDTGKMISPGAYIPAAERFGLMRAVDVWVVAEVIKKLKTISESQTTETPIIFVNISANSIIDKSFCDYVLQLIKDYDIPGGALCFEITETAAIKNIKQAQEFMTLLKKSHCLFALDDFGTGMSSLAYLKNLPVDYLKIDGSFVMKMAENTVDQAMVAAIHQIGEVMKIKTIAEHVENDATLTSLKEIGVTYAQGYYIGRPIAWDDLTLKNQAVSS